MSCGFCGALSDGGQYCVGCGEPLSTSSSPARTAVQTRERARPAPGAWLALQEIRLVACPKCGAPNSAARWQCARCGEAFDEREGNEEAPVILAPADDPGTVQPESARWLVLITAAAAVAVLAVAGMMLAARGIGPFTAQEEPTAVTEATAIPIEDVDASHRAEGAIVDNVVDGDTTTAWQVAGEGTGEWVELRFPNPVQIDHLLIWNGDQRDEGSFGDSHRIRDLLIEFPDADRAYRVLLPDRRDKVRVTTDGRPPLADVIRLRIESVHVGQAELTSVSEISVLTADAPAQ